MEMLKIIIIKINMVTEITNSFYVLITWVETAKERISKPEDRAK